MKDRMLEREKRICFPSYGLLPKWLQWLGLGQAKARTLELHLVSHTGSRSTGPWGVSSCGPTLVGS